jgi:molecular chaperone GrpE
MNEHDRRPDDAEERARQEATGVEPEAEPALSEEAPPAGAEAEGTEPIDVPQTELEILRGELAALQERVAAAEKALAEQESRALRARAEADTVRRLAASDQSRARDAGMDAVVLPVMTVWDDLRRALGAAEGGDPAAIVPGVRAVMETLERELGKLEIERVGDPGETFDPDLHEALTAVPLTDGAEPGTIAEVFEAGFKRGDRLIRPARVVVYQDDPG